MHKTSSWINTYSYKIAWRSVERFRSYGAYKNVYGQTDGRMDTQGVLFFHTYVGSGYFGGFKILNFNIFWVFQKKWIFLGYEDLVDIFLGSSQNWASFRFISMHFRAFFKVKGTELGWFFWLLKFQVFFWGAWYFWYFCGWTVDAGPEPTNEEKTRVPPLGRDSTMSYVWVFFQIKRKRNAYLYLFLPRLCRNSHRNPIVLRHLWSRQQER